MFDKIIRFSLFLALAVIGAMYLIAGLQSSPTDYQALITALPLLIGAFAVLRSELSFVMLQRIVTAILGAVSLRLIFGGVAEMLSADASGNAQMTGPVMTIVGGLFVAFACYYALWSKSRVREILENIFSIPELVKKLVFTVVLLCIYRVGFFVPLPGLDQERIQQVMGDPKGPLSEALQLASMFTGGTLQRSTLFALGIMPYISASIIFQLLATVVPALERLQKEGPTGYKKIQEYTRYATVGLCIVQAIMLMKWMNSPANPMLYPKYVGSPGVFLMGVMGLTAGTVFLMWLGEQIDEYGLGNGISLLIMSGIVARMPTAIQQLIQTSSLDISGASGKDLGPIHILFLICAFVFVVAGAILITQAQRRIPIQQARQVRGHRMTAGGRHYMPLRVNHGGVMPIIFASSLMIFPGVVFGFMSRSSWGSGNEILRLLDSAFKNGSYVYTMCYIGMIFFFAFFWTTIQFKPREMADQLRDHGSFIPGLRPGRRTAEYLERVMERITYCGAAFLALVAVIPMVVGSKLHIPYSISSFLGGTGLLIVVSVALDLVQRIEANLVMRNYGGFLGGSKRIKGAYR